MTTPAVPAVAFPTQASIEAALAAAGLSYPHLAIPVGATPAGQKATTGTPVPVSALMHTTVLVVSNQNNPASVALAAHYCQARGIPASNSLALSWTADDNADTITEALYTSSILNPIMAKIATLPAIDYIVLCRNLPTKIKETNGSVDSALAGKSLTKVYNPYCWTKTAFTSKAFPGIHLVTRLDGWSWADAMALVDNSLKATGGFGTLPQKGSFVLDEDASRGQDTNYGYYNTLMMYADKFLKAAGVTSVLEATNLFLDTHQPMAGYISWGSNDYHYSLINFDDLKFIPGAIAETLVSTSAQYLRTPPTGGSQSQISQLIKAGVTGVKGYVSEPYVDATADPTFLFPQYVAGQNLAEAFYGSSSYLGWKDVVIGDPLCCPYHPGR